MGRKMYMTVYSIPFICRCSAKLEPSSCLWWTNGLEVVVERWWLFLLLQRSARGGPRAAGVVGLDGGGALEFDAIGCMAIWSCCISVRWAKHCWRRSSRAWRNNCHDCWRCAIRGVYLQWWGRCQACLSRRFHIDTTDLKAPKHSWKMKVLVSFWIIRGGKMDGLL